MLCPIKFKSNSIELTMHASCYLGLRLTLCYMQYTTCQVHNLFQEPVEQPLLGFRVAEEKSVQNLTDRQK